MLFRGIFVVSRPVRDIFLLMGIHKTSKRSSLLLSQHVSVVSEYLMEKYLMKSTFIHHLTCILFNEKGLEKPFYVSRDRS